jgi:uncharacterized repeat protein (TIGR01451 family)
MHPRSTADAIVDGPMSHVAPDHRWRSHRLSRRLPTALAAMVVGMLATAAAASANYTVNDTRDLPQKAGSAGECVSTEGTCTLRAAIQAADETEEGQTITLPAGEYKLTIPSTGADDPATGDLDIKGGATQVTIDGAGSSRTVINANHIDRAFAVHEGNTLTIDGVTVENGAQNNASPSNESTDPDYGGAFYNDGTLTIEQSVLEGNSSYEGGGVIYSDSATNSTTVKNSIITKNTSRGEGGVLDVESGLVEFNEDTVTHNSSDSLGGVVYADEAGNTKGNIDIEDSQLLNNVADSDGGALYVESTSRLNVEGSTLSDNSSDDEDGGAIYASQTEGFGIEFSYFVGDTSGGSEGGAIYAYKVSPMTVSDNSTFENDTAGDSEGGAIYADETALSVAESGFRGDVGEEGGALYLDGERSTSFSIKRSTFTENVATDSDGGAVYDSQGTLALETSTLASNNASSEGGALYYDSGETLLIRNDTFDGNQAGFEGGAINLSKSASEGEILLVNDTIARNTAYEGGGIYKPENADVIENTIVADNVGGPSTDGGGDCYGTKATDNAEGADKGGNIDSDGSCFSDSKDEDHTGVDPKLGELAYNGGGSAHIGIETDALLPGSPAIQAGVETAADCPAADERGVTRTDNCDAGAFQAEPADVSVTVTGPSTKRTGEPITYELEVKDNGPAPATGVTVTDTIPAGTTYYSSEIGNFDGETCFQATETTVTCTVPLLGEGGALPIAITVIPTAAGTAKDAAAVTSASEDREPANDTASAETTVTSGSVERIETTKTVEVTKTVNSVETKTVYVNVPTGVSGSATTETQCKSARSEAISWKVPGGVSLRRIVVTRNGKTYKTLAGSARRVTVSMVGLPKGAVPVKITGYTASGQRYVMTRTFHLCVPAKEGGISTDYLTKE